MATGDSTDSAPAFTTVEWDDYRARGYVLDRRTVGFVLSLVALVALFLYDRYLVVEGHVLALSWDPTPLDWLTLLSLVVLAFYAVVPLARDRELAARYWRQLRQRRLAMVALAYLAGFTLVATVGFEVYGNPSMAHVGAPASARGAAPYQPPVFTSTPVENLLYCDGPVRDGMCHGTLTHPLGTAGASGDVLAYLVAGSRLVLKLAVVTGVLLVPLSTLVGTVAAYFGGRVDAALMRYLDLQQLIPGVLVYLLVQYLYGPSLFAIIVLFGLLDWDRIARQIRNDAARKTDKGYVHAARSAGANTADVLRRHLVPNVSNTLFAGVTLQIPFIVLAEVALTFLGLGRWSSPSWGTVIATGLQAANAPSTLGMVWWMVVPTVVVLTLTVAALAILGDALRDVLDPRGETA